MGTGLGKNFPTRQSQRVFFKNCSNDNFVSKNDDNGLYWQVFGVKIFSGISGVFTGIYFYTNWGCSLAPPSQTGRIFPVMCHLPSREVVTWAGALLPGGTFPPGGKGRREAPVPTGVPTPPALALRCHAVLRQCGGGVGGDEGVPRAVPDPSPGPGFPHGPCE